MSKRILIVDGDLVIFRNTAGIEKRTILVTHLKSGRQKTFKNKTEFLKFLSDSNREYVELDYMIEDIQEAVHPRVAVNAIKSLMKNIKDHTWSDDVEFYVGNDEQTFRKKLPLPSPYKNNRDSSIKPVHLQEVKEQVVRLMKGETFEGLETDDVITIRCYEHLAKGNIPILVTFDKDAMQTQGAQILDWTKEKGKFHVTEIPRIGDLQKSSSGPYHKGTGLKFLAYQALAGDPTDTYKPSELSKLKYGPAKAFSALDKMVNAQDIFSAIEKEYQLMYPDVVEYIDCHGEHQQASWKDLLSIYWKCAYMKRSWDDPSDYWKFKEQQIAQD